MCSIRQRPGALVVPVMFSQLRLSALGPLSGHIQTQTSPQGAPACLQAWAQTGARMSHFSDEKLRARPPCPLLFRTHMDLDPPGQTSRKIVLLIGFEYATTV